MLLLSFREKKKEIHITLVQLVNSYLFYEVDVSELLRGVYVARCDCL